MVPEKNAREALALIGDFKGQPSATITE